MFLWSYHRKKKHCGKNGIDPGSLCGMEFTLMSLHSTEITRYRLWFLECKLPWVNPVLHWCPCWILYLLPVALFLIKYSAAIIKLKSTEAICLHYISHLPVLSFPYPKNNVFTHWGWDKMATILQMTISNAFFVNENVWIAINIALKFVPKGQVNNMATLVQIMAWHQPGDKPLSDQMLVSILMHIYITQPQWVNKNCGLNQMTISNAFS